MSQEMFPGRVTAAAAGGFVGLFSIFNMAGLFFWASTSDFIGRKNTYFVFFVLGSSYMRSCRIPAATAICRCSLWPPRHHQHVWRRIRHRAGLSQGHVRHPLRRGDPRVAHHGMVDSRGAGPILVNYIRQYQIDSAVPKAQAYNVTMYIMAGLLVVGFVANFLIKAVDDRHHWTSRRSTTWSGWLERFGYELGQRRRRQRHHSAPAGAGLGLRRRPLLWGIYGTLVNAMKLFR